ncbi:MAG: hypothetical protein CMQ41_15425 [Gammaproteobacteria bacterium]|nr:hypothetical protein [Gammaproteobacteria bacterium]|tara:strand:+ start:118 stop:609 length:492 start_codon:yes stop_codon:yes gene_type:complete
MPLNKIFPESDEYTELDHLYELKSLQEDLLRDEIDPPQFEAPDWDKRAARDFAEALERDNFKEEMKQRYEERRKMEQKEKEQIKAKVPIWVTRPQKQLLNRFLKRQRPKAKRTVWREIASALYVSGLRTYDEINQMIDLCEQGEVDKDLYFTDILRVEFMKED